MSSVSVAKPVIMWINRINDIEKEDVIKRTNR